MKILSLRIEQFRKFDRPVGIEGFGDGLNLITGPNETGKSTLLLALRAALFERHGAKTQAVKEFSPHHVTGARPTVALTFEIGGKSYRLEKSFLKRPAATLETPDGQRFQGSDAEAELKRLLGLNPSERTSADKESPAHFGVLVTPQARSFQQPDLADETRHSLEAAVASDIAELGNQSEVDGLLAGIDETLFDLVSKRGEPKNRYKDVSVRLAAIEHEIADARAERDALGDQLDQLVQAIAERSDLQTADTAENLPERLASLEATHKAAARRQALENHRLAASQRLQAAEAKQAARQVRLEERQRITAESGTIEKTSEEANKRLGQIEEALSQHEKSLADLDEKLRVLSGKRRDLEALGRQLERLGQIDATLSALATDVRLQLRDEALERVTIDGEAAVMTSDLRQVTEGLTIEIDGVGRIAIEPKIEPMREALAAKAEAESRISELKDRLGLGGKEREAIETAWEETASDIESLESTRTEVEAARAEERRQAAEAKAALDAVGDRRTRLAERLAEIDAIEDDNAKDQSALDREITEAKAALKAAEDALQAAFHGDGPSLSPPPTLDGLDAEIADLRARIDQRRRAIDDINRRVAALEAAVAVRSGLGLDEKIDQLDRKRHLLAKERDAFALDHQALSLLQSTLRAAADDAKATFNAPLAKRLAPYIQKLLPDATPLVTPDFAIRALDRDGMEEPFLQLSDGTREQIAILARLAFADMLKDQGLPALIVLDDALAFSDDHRLVRMVEILEEAAARLQIIILSCREDRFTDIEATRLGIEPAPEQASSAA